MIEPKVLFGSDYSTKVESLNNYKKLCVADAERQFVRAIIRMKNNNFNVRTAHIIVRVDYLIINLEFHYDAERNEITIVDILNLAKNRT